MFEPNRPYTLHYSPSNNFQSLSKAKIWCWSWFPLMPVITSAQANQKVSVICVDDQWYNGFNTERRRVFSFLDLFHRFPLNAENVFAVFFALVTIHAVSCFW